MAPYEPQEDSELLRQVVESEAAGKVLDMGTGSGILALAAAKRVAVTSVLALDIDEETLTYARAHASSAKIEYLHSDLFSALKEGETFDTIVFNPPYLPQEGKDKHSALYGGVHGWEIIARFLQGAKGHLQPSGKILLLFSSLTNKERVEGLMKEQGYFYTEIAREAHFFEQLYVYRLGARQ